MRLKMDWAELTIKQQQLNTQIIQELNEEDYKAAFATAIQNVTVSIKMQQFIWEKLPK
jgi:hypothetical protein